MRSTRQYTGLAAIGLCVLLSGLVWKLATARTGGAEASAQRQGHPLPLVAAPTAATGEPEVPDARERAVNLLRLINTSEAEYHAQRGRYATWEELLASPELSRVEHDTGLSYHLAGSVPAPSGEVLPGYLLRFLTATDGASYMLSLQETADHQCRFSLYTNERTLILEARVIGCPCSK